MPRARTRTPSTNAPRSSTAPAPAPADARRELAALALLVLATLLVYWPVRGFAFVDYDDNAFVFENARMLEGLTLRNVGWAFTTAIAGNWHPLTTLTHLLDCSLYGPSAGGHHLTNVLIHLLDVVLLHLALRRLSCSAGVALLVAALFAVHPLNVESVAWVSERKNVLSMLFLFLTVWAYAGYARTGARRSYALALACFAAGLMSKAMLVTVPALLLLLDLWPLRRGSLASPRAAARDLLRLLPEKVPFAVLSLVSALLTIVTQRQSEALATVASFPLSQRLLNAAVGCVAYVRDMVWPLHLSVFYPRVRIGLGAGLAAAGALLLASVVAWRQRTRRPYLLVGWCWYLVALLPVIGLVQVGSQARADRYAYLPLLGLFVAVAMLAEEAAGRLGPRWPRAAVPAAAVALVLGLSIAARGQVLVWQDTRTLFEHALEEVPGAYVAHNGLGMLYARQHQYAEAQRHFEAAVALDGGYFDAWNNLGQVRLDQDDLEGAVRFYQRAVAYKRNIPRTWNNLGTALARLGRLAEAAPCFERALALDPAYASARHNLAEARAQLDRAGAPVQPAGASRSSP